MSSIALSADIVDNKNFVIAMYLGLFLLLTYRFLVDGSTIDRIHDWDTQEIIQLLRHQAQELRDIKVQIETIKGELQEQKLTNRVQKDEFKKEIVAIKGRNLKQQEEIRRLQEVCVLMRQFNANDNSSQPLQVNDDFMNILLSINQTEDTKKKHAVHIRVHQDVENAMTVGRIERRLLQSDSTTELPSQNIVAFSAYMSQNEYHVVDHHTIIFDTVQVNEGGGYLSHAGAFVAPVSGLYVLTYTLLMDSNSEICTDLVINGVIYGKVYSYSGNLNVKQTGTSIVVARMNKGETAFVRTAIDGQCGQTGRIYGDTWRRSIFAGWLLG